MAAMERSREDLDRVAAIYGLWTSNLSSPEVEAIEQEMDPELAAHGDRIVQSAALYGRIKAVYDGRADAGLTAEQQRLAWIYWSDFRRAGAELTASDKDRVAAINQDLAGLYTRFSQNLAADEQQALYLTDEAELAGLPAAFVSAAAAAAEAAGRAGQWAVLNTRSAVETFLALASVRSLREQVWRAFVRRGDNGDDHDNNAIASRILKLRAERARLLGYPTHAHWRLENTMAATPDNARALMLKVWPAAVARVAEEVADMQALANGEGANLTIEPWDYRYYAEKVRKARYDIDENAVTPYLQLDRLQQGAFWVAGQLYGLRFTRVSDAPVADPTITTWQVTDAEGRPVGLFYQDPFARPGKRGGAWETEYRVQSRIDGVRTPLVSNTENFVQAPPGEPQLISWSDAVTLFHEFGHALHALNSSVTYPSMAGTAVARDFVELPSQLNEQWLPSPEMLGRFAVHHATGEPIPPALVDKLARAASFNQGFATTEYLACALLDMELHLAGDADIDLDAFEREALARLGMPRQVGMRHRLPAFAHIFSGDGYSAGYYSYLWAETLSTDAAEAFREAGGLYDPATARRLHDTILSVGGSVDPAEAYRAFRGRDPDVEALMRHRGFAA
jgi:peptidyl-dipeptidase Dcp